ncbi:MAG TPA: hypothetical protein VI935_03675 [Thermodesulfobacteriota bacterium]|nr:hypothetical protein [Thermodesulfobacteriota bacterium]
MSKNDSELKDIKIISADEEISQLSRIIEEHKVFWITGPIELPDQKSGRRVQVALALVISGTYEETPHDTEIPNVFQKLKRIADWLIPKDNPNVRFEIKIHDSRSFYIPGDKDTDRRNYALGIQIWHSEGFDRPVDKHQIEVLKEMEEKLKKIGSHKDHWKDSSKERID